jgi:hypothetical protein
MRRIREIEELAKVKIRDGNWKHKVIAHWLWCDETTSEICKLLKINRPLLMEWHRWHFKTRHLVDKAPTFEISPSIIAWQKQQLMKNKALEQKLASDRENVEALQNQIAALKAALAQEKLKAEAFSTMIDIAEQEFKIEIRKKSGAKQSNT